MSSLQIAADIDEGRAPECGCWRLELRWLNAQRMKEATAAGLAGMPFPPPSKRLLELRERAQRSL